MTHHRFSRRTMLRGLGVTMALPWLESLNVWGDEPSGGQPASEPPVRLAVLFSGNGFHSKEWWAKGEGKAMELGKVLAPLADFREKMLFIRGLYNAEALKGNIHSSQTGNLLSGAPLASGGEIRSGTSIDQLLAAEATAARPRCRASCLACETVEPVGAQELFDALQLAHFVDARRRRRRRWNFIRPWPSTGSSRTRSAAATRACSTPCWPMPATSAGRSASPTSASSTNISTRCATSSSESSRPASKASCKAGGRRSTSRTSRARPTAFRKTSPTTCG